MACGHTTGIITTWDLNLIDVLTSVQLLSGLTNNNLLLFKKFKMHAGPVFGCDYSIKLDLLVSGGADDCIKLWCLSSGLILKSLLNQGHWVLRVALLPAPHGSSHNIIVSNTRDGVSKLIWPSSVTCENKLEQMCGSNDKSTSDRMGDIDKIEVEYSVKLNEEGTNFFTPQLQVGTDYCAFIKQDADMKYAYLNICDLETFKQIHNVPLGFKVTKLLAIGNRFALMLSPGSELYTSKLITLDIFNGKIVGEHLIPHSK